MDATDLRLKVCSVNQAPSSSAALDATSSSGSPSPDDGIDLEEGEMTARAKPLPLTLHRRQFLASTPPCLKAAKAADLLLPLSHTLSRRCDGLDVTLVCYCVCAGLAQTTARTANRSCGTTSTSGHSVSIARSAGPTVCCAVDPLNGRVVQMSWWRRGYTSRRPWCTCCRSSIGSGSTRNARL
eukprot:scaffold1572_cov329-Prasinococcus_capsulatus_cf.AAC.10